MFGAKRQRICACSEAATVIQHRRGGAHPAPPATSSRSSFYSSLVPNKSRNSIPTLCAEIRKDPSVFIRLDSYLTTSERAAAAAAMAAAPGVACVWAVRVKSNCGPVAVTFGGVRLSADPEKGGLMEKCSGSHWPRKRQITLQTSPIISCYATAHQSGERGGPPRLPGLGEGGGQEGRGEGERNSFNKLTLRARARTRPHTQVVSLAEHYSQWPWPPPVCKELSRMPSIDIAADTHARTQAFLFFTSISRSAGE